ncbi:MAG: PhzF family phenazine biosynthesis protein [Arenibacterium sp.]
MTRYQFDWVDAFTESPFSGNGCAVVHDASDLTDDLCTAYVKETGLVECTFTGPSDIADFKVRYFVAAHEIPFAGHPTIATVAALKSRGLFSGDQLTLETGAGIIPIALDGDLIEMTQVAPQFGIEPPISLVAQAIRLSPEEIIAPPQFVSTGLGFCITVLRDHAALRAAKLDFGAMQDLAALGGFEGRSMGEPFLVTLKGATDAGDTFSRLLLAPPSPPEDPFTGSATGAMSAYLWQRGLMRKPQFIAEQGHWMNRPGQARVTRLGPPDAMTGIRVAGKGTIVMRGEVNMPDAKPGM